MVNAQPTDIPVRSVMAKLVAPDRESPPNKETAPGVGVVRAAPGWKLSNNRAAASALESTSPFATALAERTSISASINGSMSCGADDQSAS